MRSRTAILVAASLIGLCAAAAATAGGHSIIPSGPALAPHSHGFMLYLSQSVGGGASATRPKFGFRIEQVHMMGNSGAPDAPDPMQHRALVGWQMDGLQGMHVSNMRMEFGGRVTYDVAHRSFSGLPSFRPSGAGASRPAGSGPREESKAFAVRMAATEHGMATREVFGQREPREHEASTSLMREVAASAVATFKSRATAAMQRPFATRGRPESMHERDGR